MNIKEFPGFDKNEFCERMMNDDDLIIEIMNLFLIDTPQKIAELKQAFADKDCEALQNLAHSVKGTAANVCMTEIQSISYKLEVAGKNKSLEGVEEMLSELVEYFEFVKKNLT